MEQNTHFRITDTNLDILKKHLFPGDGLEASAILLASSSLIQNDLIFIVQDIIPVPYSECTRYKDYLTWPGKYIEEGIEKGESTNLSIFLVHSHPSGINTFSKTDDESDHIVIPCIFAAYGDFHGSIILTPEGKLNGRVYTNDLSCQYIDKFLIVGHNIELITQNGSDHILPFSSQMNDILRNLKVGIIGTSGTGSIVTECLARLGIGNIVLIDDDKIEHKNLNRILNSTLEDANTHRFKVDMLSDAISKYRPEINILPIRKKVGTKEAILQLACCDILISCVDTLTARMYADLISEYFLIPLFDIGVTIPTGIQNGHPYITEVCARLDYIQPQKSSLRDRKVYDSISLSNEELKVTAPDIYQQRLHEGYIKGIHDEAPSVISLNMFASSLCINEILTRVFPFRHEPNCNYARTLICLGANETDYTKEDEFLRSEKLNLGKGLTFPLLDLLSLGD